MFVCGAIGLVVGWPGWREPFWRNSRVLDDGNQKGFRPGQIVGVLFGPIQIQIANDHLAVPYTLGLPQVFFLPG